MLRSYESMSRIAAVAITATVCCALGCDQKEKVVDIEAPGVEIEVEKDTESGAVDVQVGDES